MQDDDNSSKAANIDDSTKTKQQNRRHLLKSIAAGGAASTLLPQKWSKPVVDSVLLPAHAQMSPAALVACTVTGQFGTFTGFTLSPISFTSGVTGLSVTDAQFTFATISGTVTAVDTYMGTALASYTSPSSSGTQFVPVIFDSTCFG